MSPDVITILLFCCILACILGGLPIAFTLGGVSLVFCLFFLGSKGLYIIISSTVNAMSSLILVAVPLFLLMACILECGGIADTLYNAFHKWSGPLRGGLASGTVIICTIFAAMSGVSAAATVTMGLIALPELLKHGYDKRMSVGAIVAGGALGQLIPPSLIMILLSSIATISVGELFMGGVIPGLILSGLFITYISVKCFFQPDAGPSLPKEERVNLVEKLKLLRSLVLPAFIIFAVLGTIYMGICTPTESAAMGAFATIVSSIVSRRFRWQMLKEAANRTLRTTAMVMWITIAAGSLASVYSALGAREVIENILLGVPGGPLGVIFAMQFILFIFGCLMDPIGIIMVTCPLFFPMVIKLGFDPIWFGVVFVANMEMSYLTPPVGFNLFYMKGVAPKDITMGDIYHGAIPFVIMQAIGLVLVVLFPKLALWLPSQMR